MDNEDKRSANECVDQLDEAGSSGSQPQPQEKKEKPPVSAGSRSSSRRGSKESSLVKPGSSKDKAEKAKPGKPKPANVKDKVVDTSKQTVTSQNGGGHGPNGDTDILNKLLHKMDDLANLWRPNTSVQGNSRPTTVTVPRSTHVLSENSDSDQDVMHRDSPRDRDHVRVCREEGEIDIDYDMDWADPFDGLERKRHGSASSGGGDSGPEDADFSAVLEDLQRFYSVEEETGQDIEKKFATIINAGTRSVPNESSLEKTVNDSRYRRPGNCYNLTTPKVNEFVWNKLRRESRFRDLSLQKIQSILLKGLTPSVLVVNALNGTLKNKPKLAEKDFVKFAGDTIRLISSAFVMLCHTRRELIKPDLHFNLQKLCGKNQQISTEWLFGDDILKTVKDIQEESKLGPKQSYHSYGFKNSKFRRPQNSYVPAKSDKGKGLASWNKRRGSDASAGYKKPFLKQGTRR